MLDIYLSKEPTYKIKVVDVGAWNAGSACLFSWDDLNAMSTGEADSQNLSTEFRVTETTNGTFVNVADNDDDK